MVMASLAGTNSIHGNLFEFFRNALLRPEKFALQKQPFRLTSSQKM
jgi:hypothetical protein